MVEVMVAMSLLVTAVLATYSVLDSSSRASVFAEHRVTAANMASREIESMKSAPFAVLGLDPAASGYVATFEGRTTVAIAGSAGFLPSSTDTQSGVAYSINRYVTWNPVTVAGSTTAQGYKVFTAVVTWSENGRTQTVRQDSATDQLAAFVCAQPYTDGTAGSITGVVNTYYPGTASVSAGATTISVGSSSGSATAIAPGDLLLVAQMQDAAVNSTNTDAYGDGVSGGSASGYTALASSGLYEYAMATSAATSGSLSIAGSGAGGGLVNAYDAAAATSSAGAKTFQVIRVPTYGDVTLSGTVSALAWTGSVGGVVAIDASGTVTMAAKTISASAAGFRGGAPDPGVATSAINDYAAARTGQGKGEGLGGTPRYAVPSSGTRADLGAAALTIPGGDSGRGAPANAGGAGGQALAGGGGGAGAGAGGAGGDRPGPLNVGLGGFGGAAPTTGAATQIVLGGGGGSGQLGAGVTDAGAYGAPGGGIALVRAGTLSGTGTIDVRGGSASEPTGNGGGGGGGGGTALVSVGTGLGGLSVLASGGAGSAAVSATAGSGGGGGGGLVVATASPLLNSVTGGVAGIPTSANATAGTAGATRLTVNSSQIVGQSVGVGCNPVLSVAKSTSTPTVVNGSGGVATFTVVVSSPANRPTSTNVTISDPLPTGFTYSSTASITTAGSASRASTTDPTAGATTPTWGTFTIPGGGSVTITYSVAVAASVAQGTISSNASASYTMSSTTGTSWYFGGTATAEDVAVQPFACATPSTDTAAGGISGTVNNYYQPATGTLVAGATSVSITAASEVSTLRAGDLLLVMQMQDATINTANTTAYGAGTSTASGVTTLGGSGTFEYVMAISGYTGGAISFTGSGTGGGLVNSYTQAVATGSSGAKTFQIIRVPTYAAGSQLSGTVTALAWTGAIGGVAAFDVAGSLAWNGGTVDVSGKGFRGAGYLAAGTANNIAKVSTLGSAPALKGEGIAGTPRIVRTSAGVDSTLSASDSYPGGDAGQGAPGNAGGGGAADSGGGGGAGAAAGGAGGNTKSGYGGTGVTQGAGRAVLGGGGGAGGVDTSTNIGQGAPGGGLVLIRATGASGTGTISANGTTATATAATDGMGGGGGGGSVLVNAPAGLGSLTITANGGAGAAASASTVGAGGGGGGGTVLTSNAATTSVTGGAGGSGTLTGSAGSTGSASAALAAAQFTGQALGIGCQPLVTIAKTTTTPTVLRANGTSATYAITVANGAGRSSVTGLTVSDSLTSGATYGSTTSVVLNGGATRPVTSDPSAASTTPSWGTFTIPGGGSVVITFAASLGASIGIGTVQNSATASNGGTVAVTYSGSSSTAEDVTLTAATTVLPLASITDASGSGGATDWATNSGIVDTSPLSGVLNTYWPGTGTVAAGATTISLGTRNAAGSSTTISAGDMLLVIQMQDAMINSTNTSNYGAGTATGTGYTDLGMAGAYEYVTATAASTGTSVSIAGGGAGGGLINSYTSAAAVANTRGQRTFQVVRVPQFNTFELGGNVTAAQWDGASGGVVAIDSVGQLNMNSFTISADGKGFRGGGNVKVGGCAAPAYTDYARTTNCAGEKGEGVAGTPRYTATTASYTDNGVQGYPTGDLGRGAPGTGGGGGDSHNAGGGGGGNGGAGGTGGVEWNSRAAVGGVGGTSITAVARRLIMGGGGGAGDANDTAAPNHNGGNGGGIVILRVASWSNPGTISANGGAGLPTTTLPDGGGGGGAGGTVVISSSASLTSVTATATGGKGGIQYQARLDGAGGGGGVIWATSALNAASSVAGGAVGAASPTGSAATATAGGAGVKTVTLAASDVPGAPLGKSATGTISGAINTFYPGSGTAAAVATTITVGAATGSTPISVGDELLILQVQGAAINSTDTDSYGSGVSGAGSGFTDAYGAGRYEYVIATSAVSLSGGTVSIAGAGVSGGLVNSYQAAAATSTQGAASFEVIRVPRYVAGTLGALTTTSWNGSVGGVVAIDVVGSLALGGQTVTATGIGFRGAGAHSVSAGTHSNYVRADNNDGAKGEGFAGVPRYVNSGSGTTDQGSAWVGYPGGNTARGGPANAGGGGGAAYGGGGGGANGGRGGAGGDSLQNLSGTTSGGRGGGSSGGSVGRLYLGGGGGAGDYASACDSRGAAGGGLVVLRAGALTGTGSIVAKGNSAANCGSTAGGAGGGGGGGTVLVSAGSGTSGLSVDVSGGAGGNGQVSSGAPGSGAGGGGGGGVVLSSGSLAASTVTGGAAGSTGLAATAGSVGTSTTTVTAATIPGVSAAGAITQRPNASAADGIIGTVGPWPTSFSASSYLEFDAPALFPASSAPLPGIANVQALLTINPTARTSTTCVYAEFRQISTGSVVASGGSLGTSASPICTTGDTAADLTLDSGITSWTGAALNDLRLHLYLRDSQSSYTVVDRSYIKVDWQGRTSWVLPPARAVVSIAGVAATVPDGAAWAVDGVYYNAAWTAPVYLAERPVTLNFDGNPPAIATVSAATLSLTWQGPANTCYWGEVQNNAVTVASLGSFSAPVCRASSSVATDTYSLTTSNVATGAVSVKLRFRTISGTSRVAIDNATISTTWTAT